MDLASCTEDLSDVKLIETLRLEASGEYVRLALHLDRLGQSAARLGMPFRRESIEAALAAVPVGTRRRVRLTLDRAGTLEIQHADYPPAPPIWYAGIAAETLDSGNPWLGVKSTRRGLYDSVRATLPEGLDEMLFCNERGELCEGTITNLFVRIDNRLLTPLLSSGLLPGVLRRSLIEAGTVQEAVLRPADLNRAEAIFAGNSLRGLIPLAAVEEWRPVLRR